MPPMTHNTKVVFPFEKEEQEKLVAAFTEQKGNKLRLRYGWGAVLILETGLRAGEALALEWSDIDEEKRTLRVDKNMVRVDGKNVIQRTTKMASGKWTIPLNSKAMETIMHLKEQQVKGCAYIFANQSGEHVSYRHLLTTMERACEAAGVEYQFWAEVQEVIPDYRKHKKWLKDNQAALIGRLLESVWFAAPILPRENVLLSLHPRLWRLLLVCSIILPVIVWAENPLLRSSSPIPQDAVALDLTMYLSQRGIRPYFRVCSRSKSFSAIWLNRLMMSISLGS